MPTSANPDWPYLFSSAENALQHLSPTHSEPKAFSPAQIAAYIDHTLLKLNATSLQITILCDEAKKFSFGAVCVRLHFVPQAVQELQAHPSIGIACVVGFHEGTQVTASKLSEAFQAIAEGATELDIVLNRTHLQASQYNDIYSELQQLRALSSTVILKLILETSQLSRQDIIKASVLAHAANFDYIKTSTGFTGRGASSDDIILMRACCIYMSSTGGNMMKVKASGGIGGYEDAKNMIELGAERIGASSGVKIVQEALVFGNKGGSLVEKKERGDGDPY
ncbi:deoxyribose-phosphate aldolase [Venturia nashicola]|uniref:deoxyribose-phosphate aldolase n=1 Tax=Venturia nashicola TaxID=86259 RepID=A0A4Z1NQU8_9PEZI|nr:deoxyribose-phosphate aldolase [Venturia nashicola]